MLFHRLLTPSSLLTAQRADSASASLKSGAPRSPARHRVEASLLLARPFQPARISSIAVLDAPICQACSSSTAALKYLKFWSPLYLHATWSETVTAPENPRRRAVPDSTHPPDDCRLATPSAIHSLQLSPTTCKPPHPRADNARARDSMLTDAVKHPRFPAAQPSRGL